MNACQPFQREYDDLKSTLDTPISSVLTSGEYILGKHVRNFEISFAQYLHTPFCSVVGNGMEALEIGLRACGIGVGDEVITTPLTAVATALAITRVGAKVVFADIDTFFTLDPARVEEKITKKTKAILPVHLYGQAVDVDKFLYIAHKHEVMLLEDACQAHGGEFKGKRLGTFGVFGAFSFYPTKNLGAYGDGGAICTRSSTIAALCKKIRNYGQTNRYIHTIQGLNSRMDEIQACILNTKLKHLNKWNKKRRLIARYYSDALKGIGDIEIPLEREHATHVFHQYVVRTSKRDELLSYLQSHAIPALIHYPVPIHKQECYKDYNHETYPHAEQACRTIISLPIHPYILEKEREQTVQRIRKFYQ